MNIYDYLDYRQLLADIIQKKREEKPYFSYRWLSKKAGIQSSGFISLVLTGKRNISTELAARLCTIFQFNTKETAYFILLVKYSLVQNADEKKNIFDQIIALRPLGIRTLQTDQQEYFNRWYYAAVRELVSVSRVGDDYKLIADTLIPKITAQEAQNAVELLLRLHLIEKDDNGVFRRTDPVVSTAGAPIEVAAIHKYQIETMDLAKNALFNINKSERDISTVTLSTDDEGIRMIKERIEQCRADIMAIAKQSRNSRRIMQLNMQFFPLCRKEIP
ncbi:MAG: TIGR02147 family protein [Fibrobacter sp.]|nr:TIGR02147 family protein [Fibrobacter sp.]